MYPELEFAETGGDEYRLRFACVSDTDELYINLLQHNDYRPMEVSGAIREVNGRTVCITFKFETANDGKTMNVLVRLKRLNLSQYDVTIQQGARLTPILSCTVQIINGIWVCLQSTQLHTNKQPTGDWKRFVRPHTFFLNKCQPFT